MFRIPFPGLSPPHTPAFPDQATVLLLGSEREEGAATLWAVPALALCQPPGFPSMRDHVRQAAHVSHNVIGEISAA